MNKLKEAISASAIGDIQEGEPGAAEGRYLFSPEFLGFKGHFPGYPVLPAIVQVLTAVSVAEHAMKGPLRLTGIHKAKFHIRIGPSREIRVECRARRGEEKTAVECRVFMAGELAASFQLDCVPAEGDL